jgi:hypothetical protein
VTAILWLEGFTLEVLTPEVLTPEGWGLEVPGN